MKRRIWVCLLLGACEGAPSTSASDGRDGRDGADGAAGVNGTDGMDGLNGVPQSKADLYTVTEQLYGDYTLTVTAMCDDENDILLHGGCADEYGSNSYGSFAFRPDNEFQTSGWTCETSSSDSRVLTTYATCISVP